MFETVDYELIAEIESQQFSLPKFDVGATYNVDGMVGRFVRYENIDNRQKYVFDVDGIERRFDHDFIYLVK